MTRSATHDLFHRQPALRTVYALAPMTFVSRDLFIEEEPDPWGSPNLVAVEPPRLDTAKLDALRARPDPTYNDIEVALALMDLVHSELMASGTSGSQRLDDGDLRLAIRTLEQVTARCGQPFKLPFRDHSSWRTWWNKNGAYGSWQARRELLSNLFDIPTASLMAAQDRVLDSTLAEAVSHHDQVGWPAVDTEIGELRRHFRGATTPQDYRAVGNDCVHLVEALSRQVYDHSLHTPGGEGEPPVQKTKLRIERYIEHAIAGPENKALRAFARGTIELSQGVKHSGSPTRTEAGITADAVILLANMLRRLADE